MLNRKTKLQKTINALPFITNQKISETTRNLMEVEFGAEKVKKAIEKVNIENKVWLRTSLGLGGFCATITCGAVNILQKSSVPECILVVFFAVGCGCLAKKSHNRYKYIKNNYEKCVKDYIKNEKISYNKE